MNEQEKLDSTPSSVPSPQSSPTEHTPWSSTIYRLCEELIALRETNHRQHRMFEQAMLQHRDSLHERIGGRKQDGIEPDKILEQRERGYASQRPEFVLRRPQVIVSE